jgi:S-adenosylmethionine:tRNA ribosyltransferase-isomerase
MLRRPSYPASRLDYDLPRELIAQKPSVERRDSRLLHMASDRTDPIHRVFADLPQLLPANTHIILNNSRVIPARLHGERTSGGRVEVLYHSCEGPGRFRVLMKSRASLKESESIKLAEGWSCQLLEPKHLDGSLVRLLSKQGVAASQADVLEFLQRNGEMPLPPYIHRGTAGAESSLENDKEDRERYQTVYAEAAGSVAAPTAGLHFDDAMLAQLRDIGHSIDFVTLHVGMGTFSPLRVDDLAEHSMHSEDFSVAADVLQKYRESLASRRPLLAVGTTSLRVLHTILEQDLQIPQDGGPLHGSTRAFIYPGRPTAACDMLLTNFHLPRSSLLALVYSFAGETLMQQAYRMAIEERYRFFSYGDCMLINRRIPAP